jgi:hypothetical protein
MAPVWYFAYGSNMQTATFAGRRGITWTRALAARLSGWRLVLDKPPLVPIGEAFANVVPDPTAVVLGVAYEITAADMAHVELTEGVRIGNYRCVEVRVEPLAAGLPALVACTLTSERRDPSLRPSSRYMACLIAGAEEHRLPAEYVAFLRGVPAGPESVEALQFRPLLEDALRRREGEEPS